MITTQPRPAAMANEAALVASICRESFQDFVREFWSEIISEELVWGWHMGLLCDELQAVAELVFQGESKRHDLIINISPGTSKSTIASVMFPAWVWTRMPSARTICGSFTQPLALELSSRSRDVVQSEKYAAAFPEIVLRQDQNTKSHWKNTLHGDRYACTVGGSVTGMHAHFLIVDDPLDPRGARSAEEIKAANHWFTETLPSRKVDKAVTPLVLIQQRLHQNDPTGHLLAKGKATTRHICLPAELSKEVHPPGLRGQYIGGLMDPVRLGRAVLAEARKDLGEFGYSGQYRQTPIPAGGGMFKTGRITPDSPPTTEPQRGHWKGLCRYWDKAGTRGGGAYTVGALLGLDREGYYWLLHIVRGQWAPGEREEVIEQTAQTDGRHVVIGVEQEPGSGGKESAQNTARRLAGFRVKLDCPSGDKIARAEPFADQVNSGNVRIASGPWVVDLLDELQYFPESTYKDQTDALSGAFNLMTKRPRRVGAL